MRIKFEPRHQYDEERDEELGAAAATEPQGISMTQQQYTEEVNLNTMMERMGVKDGSIPPGAFPPELYSEIQDFTDAPDLKEMFDRTFAARDMFMQLSAKIRNRFDNSPAKMFHWLNDANNLEEAIQLGFFQRETPAPTSASVPVDPAK